MQWNPRPRSGSGGVVFHSPLAPQARGIELALFSTFEWGTGLFLSEYKKKASRLEITWIK
ncbi:hypothetical protein ACFSQ7_03470 [Paenibacillus rhizoplanae]